MEKLNPINAVIFDLDGTLSDCTHRNHYLEKTPIDLDSFDALMHTDTVIAPVAFLLKNLSGVIKIVLTARPDKYRKVTEKWLSDYKLLSHIEEIYMRPKEWYKKPDNLYKKSMIKFLSQKYNILLVIDDSNHVVDMWRENGIYCLQAKSIK